MLCPRHCSINRYKSRGVCGASSKISLSYYSIHTGEEPIISGDKGSGTIFFTYCNLKCIYCQNKKIVDGYGKDITFNRFKDIIFELVDSGVHNINLVTPTMFVPKIIEGVKLARDKGFNIPIVYNTSSYENVDTIKLLDGYVDIYLPDLKYYDNKLGKKYSGVDNYFEYASKAIDEMVRQVGSVKLDDKGMMVKGVIVRHMVMPGCVEDSKKIVKYLCYNNIL